MPNIIIVVMSTGSGYFVIEEHVNGYCVPSTGRLNIRNTCVCLKCVFKTVPVAPRLRMIPIRLHQIFARCALDSLHSLLLLEVIASSHNAMMQLEKNTTGCFFMS